MSKQQVIIFDGPDGCGKTNIAEALSDNIGVPVFKNKLEWDFFDDNNSQEYFKTAIRYQHPYILSYLEQTGSSVIFDRAHPSEFVYSRVFDRETCMSSLELCDEMSAKMSAKIIIPYRTSYDNVKDEHGVTTEQLIRIEYEYRQFAKLTRCDIYFLNVDDENLDRELQEIMRFLGSKNETGL